MTLSRYDQHTQIHNLICVYEGKEGGCSRVAVVVVQLLSHVQLFCNHMDIAARLLYPWESPGKNTGGGCHLLLQGIFPRREPEMEPEFLHCR